MRMYRFCRYTIFLAGFLSLVALSRQEQVFAADRSIEANGDSQGAIRAAVEACVQNRELFQQFSCRYRMRSGTTNSWEDAWTMKVKPFGEAEAVWTVDGVHQTYVEQADPAKNPVNTFKGPDGSMMGSMAYLSRMYMADGTLRLAGSASGGSIHLDGGEWIQSTTPFDLWPPTKVIHEHPDQFRRKVPRGDAPANEFLLEWMGEYGALEYTFDLARGSLLVLVKQVDPDVERESRILDAKECSNGGWFPMHVIQVNKNPEGSLSRYSVQEVTVTDLKIDPPDLDTSLLFPNGTTFNVPSMHNMAMTKLSAEERIGPADLERLVKECQTTAVKHGMAAPSNPRRLWLLASGAAIVVIAFGFAWRRRRLSAGATT